MSYTLLDAEGRPYPSAIPGTLGGHRRGRIYGLLDCRTALRALAAGGYISDRVFFPDEPTAIAAGYRPCGVCLSERYTLWKTLRHSGPTPTGLRAAYTATRRLQDRFSSLEQSGSVVLGHSRDQPARAAAGLLRDHLTNAGVEVRDVVDWPERAASWLRQATRFTAPAPDVWIVLIADPGGGWGQMRHRLRDTPWDPDRTLTVTIGP